MAFKVMIVKVMIVKAIILEGKSGGWAFSR